MARVPIPPPRRDFDPTEAAVSWRVVYAQGAEMRLSASRLAAEPGISYEEPPRPLCLPANRAGIDVA
jgi:hypothetical protein